MKPYLINKVYDTRAQSLADIQQDAQIRLDVWLGKGNAKISIAQIGDKTLQYTIERKFGRFYEDPRPFSDCNEHIFSWDKHIFLGTDWQVGSYADFEHLNGPYLVTYTVEDFLGELKRASRENHASRIRSIAVDNYLEKIIIIVEYV